MGKHVIVVNRHLVAANRRDGGRRPIYSVQHAGRVTYAQSVVIEGRCTLIDPRASRPLKCGATAYLEVEGDVQLIEPTTFTEASRSAA